MPVYFICIGKLIELNSIFPLHKRNALISCLFQFRQLHLNIDRIKNQNENYIYDKKATSLSNDENFRNGCLCLF